ncbi:unnamed protein product [Prorocentrum cordatum]|uniref:Uncharacterized protein n=1 Tax=Prorocentrum cordatum TaxID=2364126 RepID=A0ABN9WZZ5_9DINO|nr:unnamed protein product [Polarella glacialis]
MSLGLRRSASCPADEDPRSVASDTAGQPRVPAREFTPERRRREAFVEAAMMERYTAVATTRAPGGAPAGAGSPPAPRTPRAGAATAASPEQASSKPLSARPLKSSKQVGSVQERAEQARRQAQQQKDDEARAAKEKVCIFRKPAGQAMPAKATTRQEAGSRQEQDGADMLSVGSRHSVRSTASAGSVGVGGAGKSADRWEQKCKWQKCSSGGCWDCEWSESAKAYNYELARVRREVRDSSGSDALQEALQKGRDDARQQDQGRRMATTRVKLGRQREAERRKEDPFNWKLALELQKNSKWNIAPTGGGSNGNDEEDVPGDD